MNNDNTLITSEELMKAQKVIFTWFMEQNVDSTRPITILDTTLTLKSGDIEQQFRLITHLSFYGRDELPKIMNEYIWSEEKENE